MSRLRPRSRWLGHIDGFAGRRVHGWIREREVDEPVLIDLYLGERRVVAGVRADGDRPDVRDAGIGDGRCGFDVALPRETAAGAAGARLTIRDARSGEVVLTAEWPEAASLAASGQYLGRIEAADGEAVRGWCVNEHDPGEVVEVEVLVDGIPCTSVLNDRPRADLLERGLSNGLGGFRLADPSRYLDAGTHRIELRVDGREVASSELVAPGGAERLQQAPVLELDPFPRRGVTVIVPIHDAPDDVAACLERLRRFTPAFARLLLIDDASTDPRIEALLAEHVDVPRVRVLRNERNLGFTRTVNRGLDEAGRDDVVILNSDARVTPRWLEGLLVAARSGPRIATITPLSDRAGYFSAPSIVGDNRLPDGVDEAAVGRAIRRTGRGLYPRVPTGNGFCMFISRDCLDEVGALDADAFPRGYGEENDLCMRAFRAGWQHVIDDRTLVFHGGAKSFGAEREQLLSAGRAVVDARYPEYAAAISVFRSGAEVAAARYRAGRARLDAADGHAAAPRILFVVATQTGGTPLTNDDLMRALGPGVDPWLLRCDGRSLELGRMVEGVLVPQRRHELREPVEPLAHRSAEYDAVVAGWLFDLDADLVHLRHLGWHSLSLPRLARVLGARVVCSFHDYYLLSPNLKLVDDAGVFRGDTYRPEASVYRDSLWPDGSTPTPAGPWLAFWRQRSQDALAACDAFVTTSPSARALVLEGLPRLRDRPFEVIPHGRDFPAFHRLRAPIGPDEPVRDLVPGNISAPKGLEVLHALARQDRQGRLEFHVVGRLARSASGLPPGRIVEHGGYARDELAERVAGLQVHAGAVFSIWDETYCHTLTELWALGLPAIVFDFPTVAGRVRESGAGWVLDHRDIPRLGDEIVRLVRDPEAQRRTDDAIARWQAGEGAEATAGRMAARYLDLYASLSPATPFDRAGER